MRTALPPKALKSTQRNLLSGVKVVLFSMGCDACSRCEIRCFFTVFGLRRVLCELFLSSGF
jgi:hypothetical protein